MVALGGFGSSPFGGGPFGRRPGGRRAGDGASSSASSSRRNAGRGATNDGKGLGGANGNGGGVSARETPFGVACKRIGVIGCAATTATSSYVALAGAPVAAGGRAGGVVRGRQRRGRQQRGFLEDPDRVCVDSIMALTIGTFAMQLLTRQALTALWAKENERIAAGQIYRLATPILLHGGLSHLFVNMYSLHSVGPLVEATFGREQFCALYALSGVAGNVASYKFSTAAAVGASGSIFGIAGALAVYLHRHKRYLGERADFQLQQLGTTLAVNLGFGLTSRRIDNWGHIGGLLGGAAFAFLFGPNLVPEYDDPRSLRRRFVNRPLLPNAARAIKEWWDDDELD
jgi:membrane associated rhomboid family serine protease